MAVITVTSQLAFSAYSYSAAATGVGEVGRVDYDGASTLTHFVSTAQPTPTPPLVADGNILGLTPDPKVFWFQNAEGDGRLLVAQTLFNASFQAQPSLFSVYDAASLAQVWPTGTPPTQTWGSLVNVYNIVTLTDEESGTKYMYGVDYDTHTVFQVTIGASDSYTYTGITYSYTGSSTYTFGQGIATDGTNIYALFINTNGQYGGPYTNSTIVKLDSSLSVLASNATLAENAQNLKLWTSGGNSYFYIPAIGGEQHYPNPSATPPIPAAYNTGSKIQRIDTALTTVQDLLINTPNGTSDTGSPGNPVGQDTCDYYDIAFNADGTKVFVLKGVYTTSSSFTWWLFLTTMTAVNGTGTPTGKLISTVVTSSSYKATGTYNNGYVWALFYNTADDNVWFVRGNEIVIYDYNGSQLAPVTNVMVMGPTPASNLAPSGYSINGAAIYGVVGTISGQVPPSVAQARAAAAPAAAGKEEEER